MGGNIDAESESQGILKNVKTVVPFLPLRQKDVAKILRFRLDEELVEKVRRCDVLCCDAVWARCCRRSTLLDNNAADNAARLVICHEQFHRWPFYDVLELGHLAQFRVGLGVVLRISFFVLPAVRRARTLELRGRT